jgi:hypothetical protein
MYDNVFTLMSEGVGGGGSSSGSGSFGVDYSAEITTIHQIIGVLPVLPNSPSANITWTQFVQAGAKIPTFFCNWYFTRDVGCNSSLGR